MHVKGHSPHYASGWGLKMFEIVHVLDVKGKTRGKGILACVTQWFLRGAGEGAQGVGTDEALPLNQGGPHGRTLSPVGCVCHSSQS